MSTPMRFRFSRTTALVLLTLIAACGGAHDALDKLTGGPGGGGDDPGPPPKVNAPYPQFQLTVDSYADCDALNADMRALLAERRDEERRYLEWQTRWNDSQAQRDQAKSGSTSAASVDAASDSDSSAQETAPNSVGGSDSFTNTQEKGVDEADAFKIGDNHLFAALDARIEVIARSTLAHLGTIDTTGLVNVTLYTGEGRLVVVGERQNLGDTPVDNGDYEYATQYRPVLGPSTTEVRIYDATAATLPTLKATKSYPGTAFDSRSVGNHLVLVFSDYLWLDDPAFTAYEGAYGYYSGWMYGVGDLNAPAVEKPVRLDANGTVAGTPCGAIMKQTTRDFDLRLTRVISLDTSAPEAAEKNAAILGGGDQIYMSTTGLYVAKTGATWYPWAYMGNPNDVVSNQAPVEQLVVTRILFDQTTGAVTPVAAGSIEGRIKDQWAFKEYAEHDVLSVATSTGQLWSSGEDIAQNHLWILKANAATHNLDVVASVRDFGTGEDIRAVRYVGSTAYVVTFKKTDPLFAFDLTNPLAPRLLGELKVPGFSVYMHPVAGDLMVGIGFDAADQGEFAWYQGLQISLFDVKDPTNLTRVDNKIIGSRGSSSEVTSDHHAFFYDAETSLMAVPVVELAGGSGESWDYGSTLAFSGAIIYDVGRTLSERARITHSDLMPETCKRQLEQGRWWQDSGASLDVGRVFKVDGRLLSLSRFGVRAHPLADPQTTETTVAFPGGDALCPNYGQYYY